MSFDELTILTSGDLAELILLTVLTGVAFASRRIWLLVEHNKEPKWYKIVIKGLIICIISTIVNYALDPMIASMSPRLIIITPTVIGLWGEQFLDTVTDPKKLIKFIKWVKSLWKGEDNAEEPDIEGPINNPEKHKELLNMVVDLQLEINDACIEFHETKNKNVIYDCYKHTMKPIAMISLELDNESKDDMESSVKQKIQELYSAHDRLLDIRRELLNNDEERAREQHPDPQ